MLRRALIFALFSGAYFFSFFYRSANAVIAPDLAREMGLDAAQLGLMTSLFFGAFALAQLPVGVALDRVGPRRRARAQARATSPRSARKGCSSPAAASASDGCLARCARRRIAGKWC